MKAKKGLIGFLMISSVLLSCNYATSLPSITATPANNPTLESPAGCVEFSLTPEEYANAGTHQYSVATQVLFDQTGQSCSTENYNVTASIIFLTRDTFLFTDSSSSNKVEFTRKAQNYYEGGFVQPGGTFA